MAAPGATEEVRVGEVVALQEGQQLVLVEAQVDRGHPGAQQGAGVLGAEAGAGRAGPRVALAHEPLHHLEDGLGARLGRRGAGRAVAEGARGEAHRRVRPLRRAALLAASAGVAEHDVVEEPAPAVGLRGLGERAPDVDAGMVVRAADAGAAVRLDVDDRGGVQLTGARAVARLPGAEELREAPAVARQQRRLDRVERVREGAGDRALAQLVGDGLDIAGELLQALVIVRRDAPAEDVHRLGLAAKPGGELLGDERVVVLGGELKGAVDRVVIGDRHEVHAAALGELVDLVGRRGAFGQAERPLDAELGDRRGGRVAVQVDPAGRLWGHRCSRSQYVVFCVALCAANGPNS